MTALPTRGEAALLWARIGCLSFGGPAGQIALLHREVVEGRAWMSDRMFLEALSVCTLLPGPEAQQLATYLGWLLHGVAGGLAAGLLFVLPGAVVMMALSVFYVIWGAVPWVGALFFGLKAAVVVIVCQALWRVFRRAVTTPAARIVAVAAFVGLFGFALPFPAVVLAAGTFGFLRPHAFRTKGHATGGDGPPSALDAALAADPGRLARQGPAARRAGFVAAVAWIAPPIALSIVGPPALAAIATFFAKLAVVTFGGAYAVLAYAAQEAVRTQHWLTPGQMLDGLGLAETTPGPLILVLQFVGFLAGARTGGIGRGLVAAVLTLWVTFAPCFAMVFLLAPSVERVLRVRALASALAAITASVVGVIANLALWFALHLLFRVQYPFHDWGLRLDLPDLASLDLRACALVLAAGLLLWAARWPVPAVLACAAAASLFMRLG